MMRALRRATDDSVRLWTYVWTVIAAGIGLAIWVVLTEDLRLIAGPYPAAFWTFAVLLTLLELRPVKWLRRQEGGEVTASWAYACALLLLSPSNAAILCMGAASLLGDLTQRKPLSRALFNASQVSLSLGCGALVLNVLPYREALISGETLTVGYVGGMAVAGAAIFLTNSVLTCLVLALYQQMPVWPTLQRTIGVNASTDGMLLAIAPIFVAITQRSLLLVPLLLVTSYAVYNSARLALSRQHEALHDALTGLPNRRLFDDQVGGALSDARRRNRRAAVILMDLDGFKGINDRLGHHIGDRVLQVLGQRLSDAVRGSDMVARLGGDEFALLLRNVGDDAAVHAAASSLRHLVEQPCFIDGFSVTLGGSFGIALYPDHGDDPQALAQHADVAMYTAKHAGGGVVAYHNHTRDRLGHGRLGLLSELQRGIDHNELILNYQPKVTLSDRKVVGVEALLRWEHPSHGLIPPGDFIELAEHTDLAGPITEFVLHKALAQCAQWHRDGLQLSVAVNLSAGNLHDLRFPRMVALALDKVGLDAAWLELEITENTVMADPTRSMTVLSELRDLGVTLAIDDFGTGYSSLANLRDLPVHVIKIDRSFVGTMATNAGDATIVRSILELAHNLGMRTVAEGVENAETWRLLADLGCHVVQGYFIGRPMTAGDLVERLTVMEQADGFEFVARRTGVA
ncbi:MAG: bifunctional diguanylate cyclase/phosphodiesterase [Actinomycetota bacterium]|jgi:diguanylate cyclase (GGDEF)-like protein|nr:bifunctional diguanylate cyclase/phosphodiesterase [Actinomycetota bacterium]